MSSSSHYRAAADLPIAAHYAAHYPAATYAAAGTAHYTAATYAAASGSMSSTSPRVTYVPPCLPLHATVWHVEFFRPTFHHLGLPNARLQPCRATLFRSYFLLLEIFKTGPTGQGGVSRFMPTIAMLALGRPWVYVPRRAYGDTGAENKRPVPAQKCVSGFLRNLLW